MNMIEVAGTDRVLVDLGVAQWDRAGHLRWLHFLRASTGLLSSDASKGPR